MNNILLETLHIYITLINLRPEVLVSTEMNMVSLLGEWPQIFILVLWVGAVCDVMDKILIAKLPSINVFALMATKTTFLSL